LKLAEKHPEQLARELEKHPDMEKYLPGGQRQDVPEERSIAKLQSEIYGFVGINPDTERNPMKEKFLK
jgi:hypothetical protein